MPRLTAIAALAALALCGCASKAAQHPPAALPTVTASFADRGGDAFDSNGDTRRAHPDVDLHRIEIRRTAQGVRFTFVTASPPKTNLRYEIFGQAQEVAGYDAVVATRASDGRAVGGYVSFENSAAKQTIPAANFSANGRTFRLLVPLDPILGASPFQWRASVSTARGPRISDFLPSPTGLATFPPKGR